MDDMMHQGTPNFQNPPTSIIPECTQFRGQYSAAIGKASYGASSVWASGRSIFSTLELFRRTRDHAFLPNDIRAANEK